MEKKVDWDLVDLIEKVSGDYQGDILIDVLETHIQAKTVCEDCPEDDALALFANYLQSNGYGNVKKAVEEFAAWVIDLIPNDKKLQDKIKAKVKKL